MTKRPRFASDIHWLPGVAALALFCVFAAVFLTTRYPAAEGFAGGAPITSSIGFVLFDLTGQASVAGNGFLAAFEMIDFLLVAALVGAVLLARRQGRGEPLREGGEY